MIHSDFVHLHLHSQYSLLDGACKIKELIELCNHHKMPAVAVTDHGNLFGAVDFYSKAMAGGVKPLMGAELYLTPGSRFDKSGGIKSRGLHHITLLAKDEDGYRNLVKLVSLGYLEGFYYKPRIDREALSQYSKGLICLSGCLKSEINQALLGGNIQKAKDSISFYKSIFDKDSFYIEMQDQFLPEQRDLIKGALKLAKETGTLYVATNDVHYLRKEHAHAHEVLLAVQTQTTMDNPNRLRFSTDQFYFKSPQEMKELFTEIPEAISNTILIAGRCNVEFEFNKVRLPNFKVSKGYNQREYLSLICRESLSEKYPNITDRVKRRLEYELNVINNLGFTNYFLIVRDFINFAREHDIPVGPGRGSAAGSIVSYLLNITTIDPLKYGLLFERFLNPDRVSMPDIDIDFCYEKRQQVIDYVIEKYGENNVAQIITFGTLQARAAIRDVARALNIPYQEADKIAKLVPQEPDMNIEKAVKIEPALANMMTDAKLKDLINTAKVLEGLARHVSTHAAGVVISGKPLVELIPLYKVPDGEIITGYDMSSIDKVGLMKMDFLGLRTLTMIDECQRIIKRTRGEDVNVENITTDEKDTYRLLSEGDSSGVFQLESSGMRSLLKRLKPDKFEDLIAILALYRPGPLGSGMVDDFIKRKNNEVHISYEHILLKPILSETYGIILYQEQAMQIASDLAGFTMAEADILRRAMGKKLPEMMNEQRDKFIKGAQVNNVRERKAEKIFNLIQKFAGYGFNKSHSTAYAIISYRTAYLKAHYFSEFVTALLCSEMHNTDKLRDYLQYAQKKGLTILGPDVNESFTRFTLVKEDVIRFGLYAVKNVGIHAVESMIGARKEKGRFKSIFDFCKRVDSRAVNKKVIESLIRVGAFDSMGHKRSALLTVLDRALEVAQFFQKDTLKGQLSFFDSDGGSFDVNLEKYIPDIEEWPKEELLKFERNFLGFYISGHPLQEYEDIISRYSTTDTKGLLNLREGSEVTIGGLISFLNKKVTKGENQRMAIMKIEDSEGSINVIAFPEVYSKNADIIVEGNIVFVKGRFMFRGEEPQIVAAEILGVDEAPYKFLSSAFIEIDVSEDIDSKMGPLFEILERYKGEIPLRVVCKEKGADVIFETQQKISVKKELLKEVRDRLGMEIFIR
ncbi:MAG: DNA polymerase III subunit alpha [Candidatus Kaelpia imicola]|nr:DNA polymerase III subunit alpha [Candidatus Kaelpia imicola]